jgi:hypothetical protein
MRPALAVFVKNAMNTGHSTFNAKLNANTGRRGENPAFGLGAGLPAYTVVGGKERSGSTGLSAVLLNRGGRNGSRYSQRAAITELKKLMFDQVISVEITGGNLEIEELSGQFPFVRFILLKEPATFGQQINIAAGEAQTPLFFVLWNDLHILQGLSTARIAEKLLVTSDKTQDEPDSKRWYKRLCTTPIVQNSNFETLPTLAAPHISRKKAQRQSFATLPFAPGKEGDATIFPFDYTGIYDSSRFLAIDGFDPFITSAHWQLMDFGMRAWLRGEQIRSTQLVRVRFDGPIVGTDTTADDSYWRFFLKNLAPTVEKDGAHLHIRHFMPFLLKTGLNPIGAWRLFDEIRHWVAANSRSFLHDAGEIENLLLSDV